MAIFAPEIIKRKRDGGALSAEEIAEFILSYTDGSLPDYQMAAWLMAVFFRGMSPPELDALTSAMIRSGKTLDLADVPGVKVDKHSTGGVGDKISICLAPAVAALGVKVPMISGRGLGHTGGTLDKLESIPGFKVNQSMERSRELLEEYGLFLIGQTDDLAPSDRKIYALRDVTGTVESIPLISSSIMSKKLAEGIDALVLDVKVGKGAFMKDLVSAKKLAETLVGIGRSAGKNVRALLTDMNAPIGYAVGCALEVKEAVDVMKGEGPWDTTLLTVEQGAEMLVLGGRARDLDDGRQLMKEVLGNGEALKVFRNIVEAQGGDPNVVDDPTCLPSASERMFIPALKDGYVTAVDPLAVAMAALEVGAGRRIKEDAVDPSTGIVLLAEIGDRVEVGDPLAELHHNGKGLDEALGRLASAFEISKNPPPGRNLIIERM